MPFYRVFIFVPDGNGMRYKKVVNGATTNYYYSGTQLLMEDRVGGADRIYYIYGASGISGMILQEGYAQYWVGLLFSELIRVLKLTEQKDKNIQLIWIYLFQKALTNVSSANNSSMQELVLKYYKLAIFEMDKLKIISYDLSIKIIDSLRNLCEFRYRQNVDFSCEIVEFLDDLLDSENNLYFINNNKEIRGMIYRSLFDIAIDSIEKNQDLVIKRVSNVIGWRIKEMIEKGNSETADQLIDYALNMYNLCRDNKINEQTIVFVGTLFVIIGAFAGMEPKHYKYRNKIINELKKDDKNKEYLVVSKKIRQCEPLGRKGVLGRNPEEEFNKFWVAYNR